MAARRALTLCHRALSTEQALTLCHQALSTEHSGPLWRRSISGGPSSSSEIQDLESFAQENLEDRKYLRLPKTLAWAWEYGNRYDPLILKRQCYDGLAASLLDTCKDIGDANVVMGTPGIGKTGFNTFFLWHLLQQPSDWQAVILKFASVPTFYVFKNVKGRVQVERQTVGAVETLAYEANGPLWYLADKRILPEHWGLPFRFVLTCSPAKENYFQFVKGLGRRIIYAPCWSEVEILDLNDRVFHHAKQEVLRRMEKWGGVPRYVLSNTGKTSEGLLQKGITWVQERMQESGRVILPEDAAEDDAKACHRIFHYKVEKTEYEKDKTAFEDTVLTFASDYVKSEVLMALPIGVLDRALNRLTDPCTVKLQSALFDQFFMEFFLSGCQILWKELHGQAKWGATHPSITKKMLKVRTLPIGGERNQDAILPAAMTPEELDDVILKPQSSDNGTWDFIAGKGIYQGTAGRNKELIWNDYIQRAYDFLVEVYGKPPENLSEWFEYVFVVPTNNFETFKLSFLGGKSQSGKEKAVQKFTNNRVKIKKVCCFAPGTNEDVTMARSALGEGKSSTKVTKSKDQESELLLAPSANEDGFIGVFLSRFHT